MKSKLNITVQKINVQFLQKKKKKNQTSRFRNCFCFQNQVRSNFRSNWISLKSYLRAKRDSLLKSWNYVLYNIQRQEHLLQTRPWDIPKPPWRRNKCVLSARNRKNEFNMLPSHFVINGKSYEYKACVFTCEAKSWQRCIRCEKSSGISQDNAPLRWRRLEWKSADLRAHHHFFFRQSKTRFRFLLSYRFIKFFQQICVQIVFAKKLLING